MRVKTKAGAEMTPRDMADRLQQLAADLRGFALAQVPDVDRKEAETRIDTYGRFFDKLARLDLRDVALVERLTDELLKRSGQ